MTPGVRHRSGAAAHRGPLTLRAGRWSARHPWPAIAAWVTFVVTALVVGGLAGTVRATTQDTLRGELALADRIERAGARWAVAGRTATDTALRVQLSAALPKVVGCVFVTTFVVMLVSFRSMALAVTSILLDVPSVAAAYGVLVLVFQHTWVEDLLGFTSNGAVVTWLPLMLFVILFGLSMDYHVFVVSRIREAVARGMPTGPAIEQGIVSSASTVSSAAVIMVAVFGIFATLSVVEFKQLGVGLAAAILIDATLIRAVVLPSVMRLLGEANWWAPRWVCGSAHDR